ncbi:HD-GYP domain-containing protein [Nanoarchaeota archaeon]
MERLNSIVHVRDYFNAEDSKKVDNLIQNTMNKHSVITKTHSLRVAKYANYIGKYMGLSKNKIDLLRIAGLLHDVGKLNVPNELLEKPGRLSGDEWKVMVNHAKDGPWIVKLTGSYNSLSEEGKKTMDYYVLNAVGDHHLCYGGGGYGVSKTYGADIPFFARLLCVIDAFDAMTSARPYSNYRKTLSEAMGELKNNSETQFDPKVVNKFIRALQFGGSRLSSPN